MIRLLYVKTQQSSQLNLKGFQSPKPQGFLQPLGFINQTRRVSKNSSGLRQDHFILANHAASKVSTGLPRGE